MRGKVAQQFLGLMNKKKQSSEMDEKIKLLIKKGKLPQPIKVSLIEMELKK
jgi:hypothetical protein